MKSPSKGFRLIEYRKWRKYSEKNKIPDLAPHRLQKRISLGDDQTQAGVSHSLDFTYDSVQSPWSKKMSDRKYRQRGYMESDREPQPPKSQTGSRPGPQSAPRDREGPRSPRMMAFGQTVKCSACGAKAPPQISFDSSCQKCNADLHACRQCTHFDPAARFECSKSIPARIVNKNARNKCELFTPRTVVERETSSGPPTNARDAFAKLFKK